MKREIVRLTESDLHNIIREATARIIREGQGWDLVKSVLKGETEFNDDITDDEFKKAKDCYIRRGESTPMPFTRCKYYDTKSGEGEYRQDLIDKDPKRYKEIGHSTFDKLGRRAGLGAARLIDRFKKKFKK